MSRSVLHSSEIWSSHSSDYDDCCLCDDVSGKYLSMFQRNILPPLSGYKEQWSAACSSTTSVNIRLHSTTSQMTVMFSTLVLLLALKFISEKKALIIHSQISWSCDTCLGMERGYSTLSITLLLARVLPWATFTSCIRATLTFSLYFTHA
jgi:hypothetical protein